MFETKHIIILIISLALIVGLFFLTKNISLQKLSKILFGVGIISEVVKVFFYIIKNEPEFGGYLPKGDLPFQLCSIQILLIAIVCLSKKETTKRFIQSFMYPTCLFGGIAAILIPTYSSLNFWVITIQYFVYHIAIIVYALNLIRSKEFKFELKDYFNCLIGLVFMLFLAIYLNSMLYDPESLVNFMYVVRPPQENLPFLNNNNGWLVYISHYALLVITIATLCYIKPIVNAIRNKAKTKKQAE